MKKINESKGNLIGDLIEIRAYKSLQNEPFDFGNGIIENSNKSDDTYYEKQEKEIKDKLNQIEKKQEDKKIIKKQKKEYSRYYLNKREKNRLKNLNNQGVYLIYEIENKDTGKKYIRRYYISRAKKIAKRRANKMVRKENDFPLKGNGYKKVYDLWWEII